MQVIRLRCRARSGAFLLWALIFTVPFAQAAAQVHAGMRKLPQGQVLMGDDRGFTDERPAHRRSIPAFWLDVHEVRVADFARFVANTRYRTEAERLGSAAVMVIGTGTGTGTGTGSWQLVAGADWRRPQGPQQPPAAAEHPVTQVSWNDAHAYCQAQGKRLPTEVEFEYALRLAAQQGAAAPRPGKTAAQARKSRYRANLWTGAFPVLNDARDGHVLSAPIGSFGADALGLSDLTGNVWEWTADWYRPYAERHQPWPQGRQGEKVQRGGSYLCDAELCAGFRPSARGHATPDSALMHVGFRCALTEF
jgi:sulfatase modifying factor 1